MPSNICEAAVPTPSDWSWGDEFSPYSGCGEAIQTQLLGTNVGFLGTTGTLPAMSSFESLAPRWLTASELFPPVAVATMGYAAYKGIDALADFFAAPPVQQGWVEGIPIHENGPELLGNPEITLGVQANTFPGIPINLPISTITPNLQNLKPQIYSGPSTDSPLAPSFYFSREWRNGDISDLGVEPAAHFKGPNQGSDINYYDGNQLILTSRHPSALTSYRKDIATLREISPHVLPIDYGALFLNPETNKRTYGYILKPTDTSGSWDTKPEIIHTLGDISASTFLTEESMMDSFKIAGHFQHSRLLPSDFALVVDSTGSVSVLAAPIVKMTDLDASDRIQTFLYNAWFKMQDNLVKRGLMNID